MASFFQRIGDKEDDAVRLVEDSRFATVRDMVAGYVREGRNLAGAILDNVDLSGLDLRNADFSDASLKETNLTGCTLSGTAFVRANCEQAIFNSATLDTAVLRGANLHRARMQEANLRNADLSCVTGKKIDLSGADLTNTLFMFVDRDQFTLNANQTHQSDLLGGKLITFGLSKALPAAAGAGILALSGSAVAMLTTAGAIGAGVVLGLKADKALAMLARPLRDYVVSQAKMVSAWGVHELTKGGPVQKTRDWEKLIATKYAGFIDGVTPEFVERALAKQKFHAYDHEGRPSFAVAMLPGPTTVLLCDNPKDLETAARVIAAEENRMGREFLVMFSERGDRRPQPGEGPEAIRFRTDGTVVAYANDGHGGLEAVIYRRDGTPEYWSNSKGERFLPSQKPLPDWAAADAKTVTAEFGTRLDRFRATQITLRAATETPESDMGRSPAHS